MSGLYSNDLDDLETKDVQLPKRWLFTPQPDCTAYELALILERSGLFIEGYEDLPAVYARHFRVESER